MRILSKRNAFRLVSIATLSLLLYRGFEAFNRPEPPINAYRNSAQDIFYQLGWIDSREDLNPTPGALMDSAPLLKQLESGQTNFSWDQWMDLSRVALFENGTLPSDVYPIINEIGAGNWPPIPLRMRTTPQEQKMIASLYCKYFLTVPSSIIVLRDPNIKCESDSEPDSCDKNLLTSPSSPRVSPPLQYEVTTDIDRLKHYQFGHADSAKYHPASQPLCPDLKKPSNEMDTLDLLLPALDKSMFYWDPYSVANALQPDGTEWGEDSGLAREAIISHAHTVKNALKNEKSQSKYFRETALKNDTFRYGLHHDWRFFRGILTLDEHVVALHHIARAWQQFTEQTGIAYWYAHGSLIGHHWNGMVLPFDDDHDVQVPIRELDRLARDFNRTLVVQNPSEGNRKYLLDVTPAYVTREKSNRKNLIDARFIDVDTGVYIDITGLALNKDSDFFVSCRNGHTYDYNTFVRLRRTQFEGYPAVVPVYSEQVLGMEYATFLAPYYGPWGFNERIQQWEIYTSCERYLSQYKAPIYLFCRPSEILSLSDCKTTYGTCDRYAIQRYEKSHEFLSVFEKDKNLFLRLKGRFDKGGMSPNDPDLPELSDVVGTYLPPFRESQLFSLKSSL